MEELPNQPTNLNRNPNAILTTGLGWAIKTTEFQTKQFECGIMLLRAKDLKWRTYVKTLVGQTITLITNYNSFLVCETYIPSLLNN